MSDNLNFFYRVKDNTKGFTLIELLIVIAIIGILAGVVMSNSVSGAAQARDTKRIQELYQIAHGLQQYYTINGEFPESTGGEGVGCRGNWESGSVLNGTNDSFVEVLETNGVISSVPIERNPTGDSDWEKCSYRYGLYEDPCGCPGTYAVLYATCETDHCPTGERPDCCSGWDEGGGSWDAYDVAIFLKE